jgi:hypothetical protein
MVTYQSSQWLKGKIDHSQRLVQNLGNSNEIASILQELKTLKSQED